MGKYLVQGKYEGAAAEGLLREGGSGRVAAATAAVESAGGTIDCMYWTFGGTDVVAICDFPDDASATAFAMTVSASGAMIGSTIPLMSPEEIDRAAEKSPIYRPPGQ